MAGDDERATDPGSDAGSRERVGPEPGPPGESPPERAESGSDDDHGPGTGDHDRQTVRITRDVGEILGVDERVYSLEAEDVVTLPAANARPLLEREAAERLE